MNEQSDPVAITVLCIQGRKYTLPSIPVYVPEHPDITFVVHKCTNFSDDWTVSELTTGFKVCDGDDMNDAIDRAKRRLKDVPAEKIRKAIDGAKQIALDNGHTLESA